MLKRNRWKGSTEWPYMPDGEDIRRAIWRYKRPRRKSEDEQENSFVLKGNVFNNFYHDKARKTRVEQTQQTDLEPEVTVGNTRKPSEEFDPTYIEINISKTVNVSVIKIAHPHYKRKVSVPDYILHGKTLRIAIKSPFINIYVGDHQIFPFDYNRILLDWQKNKTLPNSSFDPRNLSTLKYSQVVDVTQAEQAMINDHIRLRTEECLRCPPYEECVVDKLVQRERYLKNAISKGLREQRGKGVDSDSATQLQDKQYTPFPRRVKKTADGRRFHIKPKGSTRSGNFKQGALGRLKSILFDFNPDSSPLEDFDDSPYEPPEDELNTYSTLPEEPELSKFEQEIESRKKEMIDQALKAGHTKHKGILGMIKKMVFGDNLSFLKLPKSPIRSTSLNDSYSSSLLKNDSISQNVSSESSTSLGSFDSDSSIEMEYQDVSKNPKQVYWKKKLRKRTSKPVKRGGVDGYDLTFIERVRLNRKLKKANKEKESKSQNSEEVRSIDETGSFKTLYEKPVESKTSLNVKEKLETNKKMMTR